MITKTLSEAITKAYADLSLYVEYQDGVVDIDHLYHEICKRHLPATVAEFQAELLRLFDAQEIELKILNEVGSLRSDQVVVARDGYTYGYLMI